MIVCTKNTRSEMYEAERWLSDPRFWTPMTTLLDGSMLFIDDIVEVNFCYGKVRKIVIEVSLVNKKKFSH